MTARLLTDISKVTVNSFKSFLLLLIYFYRTTSQREIKGRKTVRTGKSSVVNCSPKQLYKGTVPLLGKEEVVSSF